MSTSEVALESIAAFFSADGTGEGTDVSAQFFRFEELPECTLFSGTCGGEGTTDSLEVSGGDAITVTLHDVTLPLDVVEENFDDGLFEQGPPLFAHRATLPPAEADDELIFTLTRADGDVVESTVSLPPPAVVADIPNAFSRRAGFSVSAEGDFGQDFLDAGFGNIADCLSGYSSSGDGRVVTFSFDGDSTESCDVSLIVSRVRSAPGDARYADSEARAQRSNAPVVIRSNP